MRSYQKLIQILKYLLSADNHKYSELSKITKKSRIIVFDTFFSYAL